MCFMTDKKNENTFFPAYLFEITLISLFTIEVVLLLAVLFPPAVGREVDFAAQYSPRPEWYFLFLYQLTKYFPGRWTFVGAVLLPSLAFSAFLLTPFLDNSNKTALRYRKTVAIAGFGMLLVVISLTILSLV